VSQKECQDSQDFLKIPGLGGSKNGIVVILAQWFLKSTCTLHVLKYLVIKGCITNFVERNTRKTDTA
jgi:hypothetical protein